MTKPVTKSRTKKPAKVAVAVATVAQSPEFPVIHSIKGFDANLQCRGFQFEEGHTYTVSGKISACSNGFHACPDDQHPLSVFAYYPPSGSRYREVTQSGDHDLQGTKLASAKITIGCEIAISDLIARAVKWVFDRSKPEGETATGVRGAASATGWRGAASATGESGAASATGERGAASATGESGAASATGERGAASATGERGAASATGESGAASATGESGAASATGERGAASATGESGAASATGWRGAASATGWRGAASATGERGAASATGERGAASATGESGAASATGESGAASATGQHSVALATGLQSKAMATETNAICLVCRDENTGEILAIRASMCGENGIRSGVWYKLSAGGKFTEVEK